MYCTLIIDKVKLATLSTIQHYLRGVLEIWGTTMTLLMMIVR